MPYLDHAGATVPSETQLKEIFALSAQLTLANPHSHHATAIKTQQIVNSARMRVLRHFNTTHDDYIVVFTYNTTHALKIVAENFKFQSDKPRQTITEISTHLENMPCQFAYLHDSHHSVVGLRNLVKNVNAIVCIDGEKLLETSVPETKNSLFVLTAMSNFCGKKYDLKTVDEFQKKGWSVCLDAASLVSSSPLDLSKCKPNFVAFSFYKIFGFPTGIGALFIRKDSLSQLDKISFAGGTVQSVDEASFYFLSRENERAYEEGTINYYGIAQLQKGFDEIDRHGGILAVQKLSYRLASKAFDMLKSKKHPNGRPAVKIYSQSDNFETMDKQGPIVAFNLKREDGGYYGYTEVEKMCAIFGLELRTGCFCNIGACKKYLGITSESIKANMNKGKRCGDEMDIIDGRPTGAVRISFGRTSTEKDIEALENMIDTCFVGYQTTTCLQNTLFQLETYSPIVLKLCSFPIKSVQSVCKNKYDLDQKGIKNDRQFMIVQDGVTLNLKLHPVLCRLSATVNDEEQLQIQTNDKTDEISIAIGTDFFENEAKVVCKKTISTQDCGEEIAAWLDSALDLQNCRLLCVSNDSSKSFVNDSPLLLINEASVYLLSKHIGVDLDEILQRFRSNIVVRGLPPFIEDSTKRLQIDEHQFEVVDKCTRCEMICVDPMSGTKDPALLLALREYRNKQKMTFGIYIRQTNFEPGQFLQTGMSVKFFSN